MATRPTRTTRSRQPSAQPPDSAPPPTTKPGVRSKTARSVSNADPPPATTASMRPPSRTIQSRKPVTGRDMIAEEKARTVSQSSSSTLAEPNEAAATNPSSATSSVDNERESIKAYLRIRPVHGENHSTPYLERLSDTTVRMTDPGTDDPARTRMRQSLASTDADYTFTHAFAPDTSQASFFTHTTLPLVRDMLMNGSNGLLFTYGVTNSGKTYTVQGGTERGSAGILPRSFDVIFNSIGDLQGDGRFRPVRLQGVQPNDGSSEQDIKYEDLRAAEPELASVADGFEADPLTADVDSTFYKLDRNHEYTVWISYAEVYNDKVYDLLAPTAPSSKGSGNSRQSLFHGSKGATELSRKALTVKNSPVEDAWDEDAASGKYAAGLLQIRVRTAAEAKAVLKLGQLHRRVYGTLQNKQSSRSHGIVTIKLLRQHRGERNDPSTIRTSRLTLVDLAGSERMKNTHTQGDRRIEAGSINRSLMVLGQCLETIRMNQRRLGQTLAGTGRSDTRDTKKVLQLVPFRHSKLTELLMDYFVNDGRVAMIVNINPFDTGYDENAHVMRFASIAREVSTAVPRPTSPSKLPKRTNKSAATPPAAAKRSSRRSIIVSLSGNMPPIELDIVEEDEDATEVEDEESGPLDSFIHELFDEIDDLKSHLFAAHMRCADIESQIRHELATETETRIQEMEAKFRARLDEEAKQYEIKLQRRVGMMRQDSSFVPVHFAPPPVPDPAPEEQDEDVDMREDDTDMDGLLEEELDVEKSLVQDDFEAHSPEPPTPVMKPKPFSFGDEDFALVLPDVDEPEEMDTDEPAITPTPTPEHEVTEILDSSDEDEYKPPPPKAKFKPKPTPKVKASPMEISTSTTRRMSRITLGDMDDLEEIPAIEGDIPVIPNRKARTSAITQGGDDVTYIPQKGEVETVKKKKRILGNKPVVTEDQIDRLVYREEPGRTVRRAVTKRSG